MATSLSLTVSPVFSGEQKYVCKSLNAMMSSEKIKEYLRGSSCENVQEECKNIDRPKMAKGS